LAPKERSVVSSTRGSRKPRLKGGARGAAARVKGAARGQTDAWLDGRFEVDPKVHHREIEGELLVLGPREETIFMLNPTGRLIWKLLARGASARVIARRLAREFGIGVEQASEDMVTFLKELAEKGILRRKRR
jgi:hypothetical protein